MTASLLANFKTDPYEHQLKEFDKSANRPRRALLWQMRTGKTKVVIDTAFHNWHEQRIDTILLFAPNGVHSNWCERELPIHGWEEIPTYAWDSSKYRGIDFRHLSHYRATLRHKGLALFAFPASGLHLEQVKNRIKEVVKTRRPKNIMVVIDESHDYATPTSARTRFLHTFAHRMKMQRILTGTVIENSPLQAWSQFELLKKHALGFADYASFKKRFAVTKWIDNPYTQYEKVVGFQDLESLTRRMAKFSSVLLRKDCEDLPELVPMKRWIDLHDDQFRVMEELKRDFAAQIAGNEVTIQEQTAMLIKMQQCLSGYVRDEFGVYHDIIPDDINPRLNAVEDEVMKTGGRCIVWCNFQQDMDKVAARLRSKKMTVLEYHGRTSSVNKSLARRSFAPGSQAVSHLVGHPKSGGSGLDLSTAEKIIWYSHTFNAIDRTQADERATKMGGKNIPVVDFSAGLTDEYIRDNVEQKVNIADAVSREGLQRVLQDEPRFHNSKTSLL